MKTFDFLISMIRRERRHKDYQRTVQVAKWCERIMTGEDQGQMIFRYRKRETKEDQKQRVQITNSVTDSVGGKCKNQFKEVERVDNIKDDINFSETEKEDAILSSMNPFHKTQNYKDYMFETVLHLNFYDPNSFIVIDIADGTIDNIDFEPVEIYSRQVYDYEYSNGELEYLISKHDKKIQVDGVLKRAAKFTLYQGGDTLVMDEIGKDSLPADWAENENIISINYSEKDTRYFLASIANINPYECPVIPIGYLKDSKTNRRTYLSPLHSAKSEFTDLINTKSQRDLTRMLHGFVQKFAYVEECQYERRDDNDNVDFCDSGVMNYSGEQCPRCQGTGKKVHTSVQDIILMKMPESKQEHIPLSDLVHYVEFPDGHIKNLDKEIKDLKDEIYKTVIGGNFFDNEKVGNPTATEKLLDRKQAFNILAEYGSNFTRVYKSGIKKIGESYEENITSGFQLPNDFKLESFEELIAMRESVLKAGGSPLLLEQIDIQLMEKRSIGDKANLDRFKAMSKHDPFRSKTKDEILYIVGNMRDTNPRKILWMYKDEIFNLLFEYYPTFADIDDYDKSRTILYEVVESFAKSIQDKSRPLVGKMNNKGSGEEE